jgi:hypothetical protein
MISIVEHLPFREADEQKTATNSWRV